MYLGPDLATQPPAVIIHLVTATAALALGPIALAIGKGSRWHRALGYGWITLMASAALSSLFIRDHRLPNVLGYTAIHTLTLVALAGIAMGLWAIARRNVHQHRRAMRLTYASSVVAGVFALLPSRYLGGLLWQYTLGLV